MSPTSPKLELAAGFKTWAEYNAARKEKKRQKNERLLETIDKKKAKKKEARVVAKKQNKARTCEELSTLSIAVPGSILDNAPSLELRTYLAGQIARAACVFKVDEVVVYDDVGIQNNSTTKVEVCLSDSGETCPARKCCAQLARILQYLECPQYLRKDFFPHHRDLNYAGLLNPLDAPHHVRQNDDSRFREGIVINQPAKNGSYANVGLLQNVKLNLPLQPGIRVTVEMLPTPGDSKRLHGRVVSPNVPYQETGTYWGYSVRIANSLNAVFTECPYKEGYDVSIGTSERGENVGSISLPSHQHALVVFGGLAGLEGALEADDILTADDPALLFDHYVNTCPQQGSRTIRTEEAILITLAELRTKLKPKVCAKAGPEKETACEEASEEDTSERPETTEMSPNLKKRRQENSVCEEEKKLEGTPEPQNFNQKNIDLSKIRRKLGLSEAPIYDSANHETTKLPENLKKRRKVKAESKEEHGVEGSTEQTHHLETTEEASNEIKVKKKKKKKMD